MVESVDQIMFFFVDEFELLHGSTNFFDLAAMKCDTIQMTLISCWYNKSDDKICLKLKSVLLKNID